jgi:glycosyltransferase involved in cell wall biosynthesis
LKILAISNVFGRPWEPIRGPYNQIIFDELAKRHETLVLVPVTIVDVLKNLMAYRKVQETTKSRWPYARYFIYWYIPGLSQSINALFMFFSIAISYPHLIFFKKWDVVFGSWLYPDCVVANWVGSIRSIPSIAHAIGSDVNVIAQKKLQRWQIVKFLSNCFRVLTVSADLGNKLEQLGMPKDRLGVVYNGVDAQVFRPMSRADARKVTGMPLDAKVITFVGSLFREKGCFELVQAFASLNPLENRIRLVFVGQGGMQDALKADAIKFGVSSHISFAGRVLHGDLGPWFAGSDVTCLPSYREGVPNVIMESMSCGVPVVASNVGGIPEVLPSFAGIMVPPENELALASALKTALSRSWDADAIRQHVGSYTWKNTVDEIESLMINAVKDNGR